MRRVARLSALVFALAITVGAADAAQRRAKPEPPPPRQFKVEGPTRPMAMDRLVLSVPENVTLANVTTFNPNTGAYRDVALSTREFFPGTPTANYIDAFMQEAAAAGYQLGGKQSSSDLFAPTEEKRPELIVGAAITGLKASGKFIPGRIFGADSGMEATISVDWQVFDPLEKKLVYRVTNNATSRLERSGIDTGLPPEIALEAFRGASKAILSDPNFIAAVRPAGPAAAAPAMVPTVVQIPRVALNTAPFKDQIPDLRQQVVTILTGTSSGSGFYIADGMIMTNHHVIAGMTNVKIRFYGGRELPGEVIVSDHRRDIAIVKTVGAGASGLPIQFERPSEGASVFVIGSPLGKEQEGTVTGGLVSAYRTREGYPYLQSSTVTNPGNSGGPMFDDKGNVVAVVVSGLERNGAGTGLNFFIPIDDAFRVLGIAVSGVEAPTAVPRGTP